MRGLVHALRDLPRVPHGVALLATAAAAALAWLFADRPAALWVAELEPELRALASVATDAGKSTGYVIGLVGVGLVAWWRVRYRVLNWCLLGLVSLLVSGFAVHLLKMTLARYRPRFLLLEEVWGFSYFDIGYRVSSFPSGHSGTIAVVCTLGYLLLPRAWLLWITLAAGVASTRVLVNAHFVSDVLVGLYLGVVSTLVLYRVFAGAGYLSEPAREFTFTRRRGRSRPPPDDVPSTSS